jgi:uncharacterized protein (DUF2336 family)
MGARGSLIGDLEYAISHGMDAKRAMALRRITDLFVSTAERLTEDQVDVFDGVMRRLVDYIETRALIELSKRLAPIGNAPPQTVRQLAYSDDIDVAQPVLSKSERIVEADLITIAKTKSQQHLLAISGRKQLSEQLTDVLVTRGNTTVTHSVADNPGAKFSPAAMAALADCAETNRALGEKLVLRPDLPLHVFSRLLSRASDIVINRLLGVAPTHASSEVRGLVTKIAGEVAAEAVPLRNYAAALRSVLLMSTAWALDEHKLWEFANAKRLEEAVAALSILSSVPLKVAEQLFFSKHVEPLLVLCRSANLKWPTVRAMIQIRPGLVAVAHASVGGL